MTAPQVSCSQDALFFPLPITGGIENIVQLRNLEDARVAYKIRATIRNRYAVRPLVGFLHPREETFVKFLLDPATMEVDGKSPDESTKDAFLIDFAFAPSSSAAATAAATSSSDTHREAAAFWKSETTAPSAAEVFRKRLACVFTKSVPKSLTVHVNAAAAAAVAAASPAASTAQHSSNKQMQQPSTGFSTSTPTSKRPSLHFATGSIGGGQQQQQQQQQLPSTPTTANTPRGSFRQQPPPPPPTLISPSAAAVSPAASTPESVFTPLQSKPSPGATGFSAASARSSCNAMLSVEDTIGPVPPTYGPFFKSFILFTVPWWSAFLLLLLSFAAALIEESVPRLPIEW